MRKFKFLASILLFVFLMQFFSFPVSAADNKFGLNIVAQAGTARDAANYVKQDGWVVFMPYQSQSYDSGNIQAIVDEIEGNYFSQLGMRVKYVIRGHYPNAGHFPDTDINSDWADRWSTFWAQTLARIEEKIPRTADGSQWAEVYFIPWNEPNLPRECNNIGTVENTDCAPYVTKYISSLRSKFEFSRIKLLSPAMGISAPNFESFVNALGGASFLNSFDGIAFDYYDFESCGSAFCNPNPYLNPARFEEVLNKWGVNKPAFMVEVGVVAPGQCGPGVPDCPDFTQPRITNMLCELNKRHGSNPRLAMFAPLTYDPESKPGGVNQGAWFWQTPQTKKFYEERGTDCGKYDFVGPTQRDFLTEDFRIIHNGDLAYTGCSSPVNNQSVARVNPGGACGFSIPDRGISQARPFTVSCDESLASFAGETITCSASYSGDYSQMILPGSSINNYPNNLSSGRYYSFLDHLGGSRIWNTKFTDLETYYLYLSPLQKLIPWQLFRAISDQQKTKIARLAVLSLDTNQEGKPDVIIPDFTIGVVHQTSDGTGAWFGDDGSGNTRPFRISEFICTNCDERGRDGTIDRICQEYYGPCNSSFVGGIYGQQYGLLSRRPADDAKYACGKNRDPNLTPDDPAYYKPDCLWDMFPWWFPGDTPGEVEISYQNPDGEIVSEKDSLSFPDVGALAGVNSGGTYGVEGLSELISRMVLPLDKYEEIKAKDQQPRFLYQTEGTGGWGGEIGGPKGLEQSISLIASFKDQTEIPLEQQEEGVSYNYFYSGQQDIFPLIYSPNASLFLEGGFLDQIYSIFLDQEIIDEIDKNQPFKAKVVHSEDGSSNTGYVTIYPNGGTVLLKANWAMRALHKYSPLAQ